MLPNKSNELALYPWDAYYYDGVYEMRSNVLDVDGNWYPMSNPIGFQIDNFAPFVYGMTARFSNGPGQFGSTPIYSRFWGPIGNGKISLGLRQSQAVPDPSNPGSLTLWAMSSEAMHTASGHRFKARIPGPYPNWVEGTKVATEADGREVWQFNMGASGTLAAETCYRVEFEGQDLAGNQLLNFELPAQCTTSTLVKTLPFRNGSTSWANPHAVGADKVHFIKLNHCGQQRGPEPSEKPCISLNEVTPYVHYATAGNADGGIKLEISGDHPDAKYIWTDATGTEISDSPSLSSVAAGTYCLEILEYCCSISGCFEVGECNTEMQNSFTHPTSETPQSGEIDMTVEAGSDPVTFIWSNGATTEDLSNLSAGIYCVTATDFFGCQMEDCITLVTCTPIEVAVAWNVGNPTGCGQNDGGIRLLSRSASGGSAPYSFAMLNSAGVEIFPDQWGIFSNLKPDTYCLIATDVNGCTGSICTELGLDYLAPAIEAEILPACAGLSNGQITLTAFDNQLSLYQFNWSNGTETIADLVSENQSLIAGKYCVTVSSDLNACTYTSCFDVPEISASQSMNLSASVLNPCPHRSNGSIDLTVNGGTPPYAYEWTNIVGAYGLEDVQNVEEGTYAVTVTDYCGNSEEQSYTLTAFSYNLNTLPACSGEGSVMVENIAGGTPPYTYSWQNPTSPEPIISDKNSGRYCVTVSDARGCSNSNCIVLQNKEAVVEPTPACKGMSDGAVDIQLHNPDNEAVNVIFNGSPVYQNNQAPTVVDVQITGLEPGSYGLIWDIGACNNVQASSTVKVNPENIAHSYINYENDQCFYQDMCKGQPIEGSITVEKPTNGIGEAQGTSFWTIFRSNCRVPIYCGSTEVDSKKFDLKRIRVAQYRALILSDINLSDAYREPYLNRLLGERDCSWVRFCPATYEIYGVAETLAPEGDQAVYIPGSNCYNFSCGIINEDFCVSDYWDIVPGLGGEGVTACNPGYATIAELRYWSLTFPQQYIGSQLDDYLLDTPIAPSDYCQYIRFCWSTFTILNMDELEDIPPCEEFHINFNLDPDYEYEWIMPLDPLPNTPLPIEVKSCEPLPQISTDNDNSCAMIFCPAEISNIVGYDEFGSPVYGYLRYFCDTQTPGFTPSGSEEKLVITSCSGQTFTRFGAMVFEGKSIPKALIQGTDYSLYQDYQLNSIQDTYYQIPQSLFFIDDWDADNMVMIRKPENSSELLLECMNTQNDWHRRIGADSVKIKFMEKVDSTYWVGGVFVGKLSVDDEIIYTSLLNPAAFILKFETDGKVREGALLDNINAAYEPVMNYSQGKVVISAVEDLLVDTASVPAIQPTLVNLIMDSHAVIRKNVPLVLDDSLTLIKTSFSIDGEWGTYLMKGKGRAIYGGSDVVGENDEELLLLITTKSNQYKWAERITTLGIATENVDLIRLPDGLLMLGVTFNDSLSIQGSLLKSHGGEDIALIVFDKEGNITWSKSYGTIHSENLKKMVLADGKVFIGGDFGGNITMRKLADKNMLFFGDCPQIPYTTHLDLEQLGENRPAIQTEFLEISLYENQTDIVKIFPNPASDAFILDVPYSFGLCQVDMIDQLGRVVQKLKGQEQIIIPIEILNDGFYTILIHATEKTQIPPIRKGVVVVRNK